MVKKTKFKKIEESKSTLVSSKPLQSQFAPPKSITVLWIKLVAKYSNLNLTFTVDNMMCKILGTFRGKIEQYGKS